MGSFGSRELFEYRENLVNLHRREQLAIFGPEYQPGAEELLTIIRVDRDKYEIVEGRLKKGTRDPGLLGTALNDLILPSTLQQGDEKDVESNSLEKDRKAVDDDSKMMNQAANQVQWDKGRKVRFTCEQHLESVTGRLFFLLRDNKPRAMRMPSVDSLDQDNCNDIKEQDDIETKGTSSSLNSSQSNNDSSLSHTTDMNDRKFEAQNSSAPRSEDVLKIVMKSMLQHPLRKVYIYSGRGLQERRLTVVRGAYDFEIPFPGYQSAKAFIEDMPYPLPEEEGFHEPHFSEHAHLLLGECALNEVSFQVFVNERAEGFHNSEFQPTVPIAVCSRIEDDRWVMRSSPGVDMLGMLGLFFSLVLMAD